MPARIAALILFAGSLLYPCAAKAATNFQGYITSIVSADEFDVGERHVGCDAHTKWKRPSHLPGYLASPRVGMFVFVEGDVRKGAFVAKSVEVNPRGVKMQGVVEGRALIQERPQLHVDGESVEGRLWVDGHPMQITPQTKLIAPGGGDLSAGQIPSTITTNVWATYQATRGSDGALTAARIAFEPNIVDADEKDFRDKAEPEFVAADPARHKPAELKFGAKVAVKWQIVPDQDVQDYITRIGNSLVPRYQNELPSSDPTKIDFRFYVVASSSIWLGNMEDAADLPNGIVLLPREVLAQLDNEAQLAAWLSNCIAHVIEKQDYLHHSRLHGEKYARLAGFATGLAAASVIPGLTAVGFDPSKLVATINQRCDRIGLTYMLQQGYDIREAPFAHIAPGEPAVTNPMEPDQTPPARTDKLMEELQLDYSATNYASLKTNREAYAAIKVKARAAMR